MPMTVSIPGPCALSVLRKMPAPSRRPAWVDTCGLVSRTTSSSRTAASPPTMPPWWHKSRKGPVHWAGHWPRRMTSASSSAAPEAPGLPRQGPRSVAPGTLAPRPGQREVAVPRGKQMPVRQLDQGVPVSILKGPEDLMMLAHRSLLLLRRGQGAEADGVRAPGVFMNGLGQHLVSAQAIKRLVEGLVAAEHGPLVVFGHRAVVGRLNRLQGGQGPGVHRQRHAAHGFGLEQAAHLVEVDDFLFFETPHQRTDIAPALHQPHLLESRQHLPDDVPLFTKPQHQLVFDQALPRHEKAQNDVLLEDRGNLPDTFGNRAVLPGSRTHHHSAPG